ncbi:ATP-binding protein [Qingshengfaniella alkalisoli]|uniref:AAA family ATPase n=1 Tax=Qingshengfaniella alkalisoli TaxID=2599296 RepID=A0A5B8J909_9RHOB|nr:adenylate/guanylate cyclase domain-containing protein [Qingshengfaniella alkalisoli]QDY70837.1 AAA family ATPase [Qingshengfaniella alkalisoli]
MARDIDCNSCGAVLAYQDGMRFCAVCGAKLESTPPPLQHERRQVTVLFADIVDYTGHAARVDPEELRAGLDCYYRLARTKIGAWGGMVAEYLGDGVVGYFGVPVAFQDTADRAIGAAHAIIADAPSITIGGTQINIRAGIATGQVLVELDGQIPRITGSTSVLASRIQGIAAPQSVCVSDLTRELARPGQRFEALGEQALKGFEAAVPVWRSLASTNTHGPRHLTPLVGRDDELARLRTNWENVRHGDTTSQPLLIIGGPGIGKSRLVDEHLMASPAPGSTIILRGAELHRSTMLYPVIEWFRALDNPDDFIDDDPHLAALDSLAAAGNLLRHTASAKIRADILDALMRRFRDTLRLGASQFLFEDIHWMDDTTLELLRRLSEETSTQTVQIVATSRPGVLDADAFAEFETLELSPLQRADVSRLVERLAGTKLSDEDAARIVEKSDGIPIFAEHLARASLRKGTTGDDAVPDTLSSLLSAWIDRAGPARKVARIASILGRSFDPDMVSALSAARPVQVAEDLDALCRNEILIAEGERKFSFRHDLLRDAAAASLTRVHRKTLHKAAAEVLEERAGGDILLGEIAHHYSAGEAHGPAADWWQRAAMTAMAKGAFAEAVQQFDHALAHNAFLASGGDTTRKRAELLAGLAATHMQTSGFTGPNVMDTYSAALAELKGLSVSQPEALPIYWGIFTYQILIGDLASAEATVGSMAALLDALSPEARTSENKLAVVGTENAAHFYSGRFNEQVKTHERTRALYRAEEHAVLIPRYGMDIYGVVQAFTPHSAAITGRFEMALNLIDEADAHQKILNVPLMLPHIDVWNGVALSYMGKFEDALDRIDRGIAAADAQGAAFWSATGRMWRSVIAFEATPDAELIDSIRAGLDLQQMIGVGIGIPYWSARLAEAMATCGDIVAARTFAQSQSMPGTNRREGVWRAERWRICGRIEALSGDTDAAMRCFEEADNLAQSQDALLWQLNARIEAFRLARGEARAVALREVLDQIENPSEAKSGRDAQALLSDWQAILDA